MRSLAPGDLLTTDGGRAPNLWPELNSDLPGSVVSRKSVMVMLSTRDNYVMVLVNGQLGYVFRDWVRRLA